MSERKSKLTLTDCTSLHRKMAKAQEQILQFMAAGCPKAGWSNDLLLCVTLLELDQIISDKVKDKTKSGDLT